ncbi:MAG: T9SS type A sorting domain-containing protein [Ignavibacteria bacterium]|nr:T9SS type A sorting domain-containing protein [Ignavibacteria bacterium]
MLRLISFLIIIFSLLIQSILFCQYQNVTISSQYLPEEVSIMMNPKNPLQLVAGSNISTYGLDSSCSGYYFSTNGGYNWTGGILHSTLAIPSGDPVIIVDTAGNFYFIQNASSSSSSVYDLQLVMKSTDGGMTWPTGSTYGHDGKMQDKPWGCVDWSNSIYRNNIYITWTEFSKYFNNSPSDSSIILFTKSTNGGANWSQPLRISKRKGDARDSSNTVEGAVPCTGPNGDIYVSWSGPIGLHSGQYGIFFNKSTDGGNTWLDSERVATTQPGGWNINIPGILRCNGFPVTCCDLSNGPNRGTIYINFSDQRNGVYDTDIWLIKSTNGGFNWSLPKRVNNDLSGNQQFFNWMTIDQATGYIYCIFYDQRNISLLTANVYIACSSDGGETFRNTKITTTPFFLNSSVFFGDYINISAHNGHVRPIWMGIQNFNNLSIYTAITDTFYFNSYIEHNPIASGIDTSGKTAITNMVFTFPIGTGSNAPRLYYKVNQNSYTFVNAFRIVQNQYEFRIPGQPPGTQVTYYIAAQDSLGTVVLTSPEGGNGLNPPGTIPPPTQYTYFVYSNYNQCSNTLPKPINDNQATLDTIILNQPGYIAQVKVNLTLNHQNDGDLILQLIKSGNATCMLSQRNGQGGQNFTNTTFDDDASISITQGAPPYSGGYRPQSQLSIFNNRLLTGTWIFRVIDAATGSQGTLANWCIIFLVKPSVNVQESGIPVKYDLFQNYPNPFNSTTRINYSIPKNSNIEIKIYDMLGREVRTLVNEYQNAGNYVVMFNAGELASGMYFYRLKTDNFTDTKKLVLVK